MTENSSNDAPLIPMSQMFMASTPEANESQQPADRQSSKKASPSYTLQIIDSELGNLGKVQTQNNEEIKKRLTEIQTFRESNLVVVGAIGGLKKIKEKL